MFTLSVLREGFARGLVYLHTLPPLGRKPSPAKSRVSITSKLIQSKGLQVQHFGHLRKTGGRGSYRLVHTTHHPVRKSPPLTPELPTLARLSGKFNHSRTYARPGGGGCTGFLVRPIRRSSKSFVSPAYKISVRNSFASPTYAKTGGGGTSSQNSFPRSGLARQFTRKCRRADIPDFPPHISYFFQSHTTAKKVGSKTDARGQRCRGTINRALFSFIPLRKDPRENPCHRYVCDRIQYPVKQQRSVLSYHPPSRPRWRA